MRPNWYQLISFIGGLIITLLLTSFFVLPVLAQNCQQDTSSTSRVVNGLISTPSLVTGSKFGNTSGSCVSNTNQSEVPQFRLPSYNDLKSQFFSQSKVQNKNTTLTLPITFSQDGIYNVAGPITIGANSFSGSGTEIIFIDGDININSNIIYHTSDSAGGLVLINSGNVNIDPSVTEVDAVVISGGVICSAGSGCNSQSARVQVPAALTVNGSFISLTSSSPIAFLRDLYSQTSGNSIPAEVINQKAKYLAILNRNNLMTQTLTIRTEGTNYAGRLSAPAPSVSLSLTPSNGPYYTTGSVTVNWTVSAPNSLLKSCKGSYTINSGSPQTFTTSTSNGSTSINTFTAGTYVFTMTCQNGSGINKSSSISVNVIVPPPTVSLTINSQPGPTVTVNKNTNYTLAWTITGSNITSCTASTSPTNGGNNWTGAIAPSNSSTSLSTTTVQLYTHTLTCTNSTSSTTASINANVVNTFISFTPNPITVNGASGIYGTVAWAVPAPTTNDFLALYSAGGANGPYFISQLSTGCAGNAGAGSCQYTLTNNLPKGPYEMRFIGNGNYTTPVVVSSQFTINN